jgi:HEAT repeat protein
MPGICLWVSGLLLLAGSWSTEPDTASAPAADRIIAQYLAMPFPQEDPQGRDLVRRRAVLDPLVETPKDAVAAVRSALPRIEDPRRRSELLNVFRRIQTPEAAEVLGFALKDRDERVRGSAISELRLMARRVDRAGGTREQRGSTRAPAVPGLVTHLLSGAGDPSEQNRVAALYALADTREPEAVEELERRLGDPAERVRLKAACLLTEFNNTSGLPELKRALARLRVRSDDDPLAEMDTEMLLASFERITGKSFGPIPINPLLSSDTREIPRLKQRYRDLLAAWSAWWAWQPPATGSGPAE